MQRWGANVAVILAEVHLAATAVLLGFALRLFRLAHLGDLEFDEIVSVRYAALPTGELLSRLAGALFEHPPAFYLALRGWRALAGQSDAVARLFSVVPGTLTIPLAFAVGRHLFDRTTGVMAALLVALAPLLIFHSREARMYALVGCLALASFWLFVRSIAAPRRAGAWIAYAVVGAVATYVHYLGAMVLAAQVVAAVVLRHRAPHALRPVVFCAGVIALLVVPWALVARGTRASLPALALDHLQTATPALWTAWQELAGGPGAGGALGATAAVALLLLAVLGFPRRWTAQVTTVAALLAGLGGLLFALGLGKPVQSRYVLPIAPLVYVCVAAALRRLYLHRKAWAICGVAGVLLGLFPFYARYYVGYARADYSDVTRRIAALERPGDAVLLTGPWQAWYFDYYYTGSLTHAVLPADTPPALHPDEAAVQLTELAQTSRRLWFVQAGLAQADPTNFVERWLQRHSWAATREAHQNAVLSLYALQEPRVTRPLRPIVFGEALRLGGGWVDGEEIPSGDVVRLTLEFEALAPIEANLKASLRLAGIDGQRVTTDFDLVDRSGEVERSTSGWAPGHKVTLRRGIWAPASLGPQPYDVRLVIYDPTTLTPLIPQPGPAPAGAWQDHVRAEVPGGEALVGDVYVTQSLAALSSREAASREVVSDGLDAPHGGAPWRFGGGDDFDAMQLVGLRWGQRNPGAGPLIFDLLWRLEGVSGTEHRSTVVVVDAAGVVWSEETRPLFGGAFAMQDWREGESLQERRSVDLSTLPAGRYRLLVGLEDARGRALPLQARPGMAQVARFDLPYRRPFGERLESLFGRLVQAMR